MPTAPAPLLLSLSSAGLEAELQVLLKARGSGNKADDGLEAQMMAQSTGGSQGTHHHHQCFQHQKRGTCPVPLKPPWTGFTAEITIFPHFHQGKHGWRIWKDVSQLEVMKTCSQILRTFSGGGQKLRLLSLKLKYCFETLRKYSDSSAVKETNFYSELSKSTFQCILKPTPG